MARASNFTTTEINIMLNIIKKYKHIIDMKKNDQENASEKLRTWKIIVDEFNSYNEVTYRSEKVLRTKYFNLKKLANAANTAPTTSTTAREDVNPIRQKHRNNNENMTTSVETLTDDRINLIEEKIKMEINIMNAEHQHRMKLMLQKFELEKKEIELRCKLMQEKHDAEMLVLKREVE